MDSCRIERNKNYTVMSNYHLRDPRLSLKAIGLLSKMLSLPPEWDYTIRGLSHICREGRDAIRAAIEELERAGYISRHQKRSEDGLFEGNEYIIREAPLPGFSSSDLSLPEIPAEINKDILNTKLYTPPIVPPTGETTESPRTRSRRQKSTPDWKPDEFEKFWAAYPRKDGRLDAIKAWDKLKPDDDLLRKIFAGLLRATSSRQWQDRKYIKHASGWLNGRRWEDEPDKPVDGPKAPVEEVPVW